METNHYQAPGSEVSHPPSQPPAPRLQKLLAACLGFGSVFNLLIVVMTVIGVQTSATVLILTLVFLAVFLFMLHVSRQLWKNRPRSLLLAMACFAVQVPVVSSDAIVYYLVTGFSLNLLAGDVSSPLSFYFGGQFAVYIGNPAPLFVGINVFALFAVVYLWRQRRRKAMA